MHFYLRISAYSDLGYNSSSDGVVHTEAEVLLAIYPCT